MRIAIICAALAALAPLSSGCGDNTVTSPTATETTTVTVAAASITESFQGTLPAGGSKFYAFTVGQYGTVTVALTSIGGAFVPPTVQVSLGIGTPEGTGCTVTAPVTVAAGAAAQVTGTQNAGVYCARIADIGNLFAPATFAITIAHP